MEPPESSPPQPLPEAGEGKEVKEAHESKLGAAEDTATETSDVESPMAAQRRLTEGEGELEGEEHQEGDRMTTESLFEQESDRENKYYGEGKEKVEESDNELILDIPEAIAETSGAGSSMAAQRPLTERYEGRRGFIGIAGEEESASTMFSNKSSPAIHSFTSSSEPARVNHQCALYRVHSNLRGGNDKHYEPVMVSIGPYHHGKRELQDMEEHKRYYMNVLLERVEESRDGYVDALQNGEREAFHCYRDTHQMNVVSFRECMVCDGFFLIELFRGTWRQDRKSDMLFNRRWMLPLLKRDMLLFENQVPLFVLRALFALTDQTYNEYDLVNLFATPDEYDPVMAQFASTRAGHDSDSKFVEQALGFFYFNDKPVPNLNLQPSQLDRIPHLLGLVYEALVVSRIRIDSELKQQNGWGKSLSGFSMINIWSPFVRIMKAFWSRFVTVMRALCSPFVIVMKPFVPKTPERPNNSPKSWEPIRTAVGLKQVGVQFVPANDREAFYDIRFSDGVLSIPPLVIHDNTESFFRNLVAYEQFSNKYFTRQQVGNYLMVMDCLINSAKDVELLRHCGIIENGLGDDEELSTVFNQLSSGVIFYRSKFLYTEMFNEVNKFCKNPWNKRMAKLKNKYFGSPWSVISFVAALLLLLFTAFQTGYSAASYYSQPKSQG